VTLCFSLHLEIWKYYSTEKRSLNCHLASSSEVSIIDVEIALLFGHMKRTASIRAKTACSLYSLSRSDLDKILEVYPDMAEKLQKTAEERLAHDLQRNMGKAINDDDDHDDMK
jgi:hypothetical protein